MSAVTTRSPGAISRTMWLAATSMPCRAGRIWASERRDRGFPYRRRCSAGVLLPAAQDLRKVPFGFELEALLVVVLDQLGEQLQSRAVRGPRIGVERNQSLQVVQVAV